MCYGLFLFSKNEISKENYSKKRIFLMDMKVNTNKNLTNTYPYTYLITNQSCSCDLVQPAALPAKLEDKQRREELLDLLEEMKASVPSFALLTHSFQGYFDEELVEIKAVQKIDRVDNEFVDSLHPDTLYKVVNYLWKG
ncbi:hypothetical protein [Bacillus badius]|uniref:hypothetical protein n=1 Tax=Bacillus badius TaxID=1455 RepID=UPI0005976E23|nr:hypothetical protein [Bacillus badius]KIL73950.1 hypothetical protein SD78_3008 [Bacillus badius]